MRYLVELKADSYPSDIEHLGQCGNPKGLPEFVVLDSDRSENDLSRDHDIHDVSQEIFLELMGTRTVNWALTANDVIERSNLSFGGGARIYVHDSEVDFNEEDLTGRGRVLRSLRGKQGSHGTSVASMAGGRYYGVAPESEIVSVSTDLSITDIVKGLDMIVDDSISRQRDESGIASIVNMSYGGLRLPNVFMRAIERVARSGIVLIAAAGNYGMPYAIEPASSSSVIGVGSLNSSGELSPWSNYGNGVDLYAPGQDVKLASKRRRSPQTVSGTSFSSPLIAGLFAIWISGNRGGRQPTKSEFLSEVTDTFNFVKNYPPSIASTEGYALPLGRSNRSQGRPKTSGSNGSKGKTPESNGSKSKSKEDKSKSCEDEDSTEWVTMNGIIAIIVVVAIIIILAAMITLIKA